MNTSTAIFISFLITGLFSVSNLQRVPVLVWSSQPDHHRSRSIDELSYKTQLEDLYPENILDSYVERHETIPKVLFVQNNLDVEQFSQSNLPFIAKLFDENNAQFFPNSKYEPNFYSSFETIVPLNGDTVKENEPIIKSHVNDLNQTDVIFVLTGRDNSFYKNLIDDNIVKVRSKRETLEKKEDGVFQQFPTGDAPCILFHSKNILLSDSSKVHDWSKIIIDGGKCEEDPLIKNFKFCKYFNMSLNDADNKNIKLNFGLSFTKTYRWSVESIDVNYDGKKLALNKSQISLLTEESFSYSCSQQNFTFPPPTQSKDSASKDVILSISQFQLQPFFQKKEDQIYVQFEESTDCAVWFTLPIFSSLIVLLLLVTILFFAIRAVLSISTPDRFENPKSKGLIIANFEE